MRMKKSNKGISDVVVTVLIIMIIVVAVAMVGTIIIKFTGTASESLEVGTSTLSLAIIPQTVLVPQNPSILGSQYLYLAVQRKPGEGDMSGFNVVVQSSSDQTYSEKISASIGIFESKEILISLPLNFGQVKDVLIYPIGKKSNGKEFVSNAPTSNYQNNAANTLSAPINIGGGTITTNSSGGIIYSNCSGTNTPGNPTGFSGTPNYNSITLNWSSATNAYGYNIYYSSGGSYILLSSQTATSYTHSSLTSGTTYDYRLNAYNICGQQSSNVSTSATTTSTPLFSYTLSNGGNVAINQGSSATQSITATLSTGSTQAVSFSISGLPSGVSYSFSSTSCNPNCVTTLTLNANASATIGTSTIIVTGTSSGTANQQTQFSLNVSSTAINYNLNVTKLGTGFGVVTGTSNPVQTNINCGSTCFASYSSGTQVTLTAAANFGSTFAGWSGAGCSGTGTCSVTMNSNQLASATFNTNPTSQYYMSYDGVDDRIDILGYNMSSDNFALSFWFNTRDYITTKRIIEHNWLAGSFTTHIASGKVNGNILTQSGTQLNVQGPRSSNIQANRWYHLVLNYNGTRFEMYLDGVLESNYTFAGVLKKSVATLFLGSQAFVYSGSLDEVRIYNRALTPSEVSSIFSAGKTYSPSLVVSGLQSYYNFDEAQTSGIVIERVSGIYNGTLVNAPTRISG